MGQVSDNIAYVSTTFTPSVNDHEFDNLQSAIDWVGNDKRAKIILNSNLTNISKLNLSTLRSNVIIDGLNEYDLTFSGDIVDIGKDQYLKFHNISHLTGGKILLNDDGSNFRLYNIGEATLRILTTNGKNSDFTICNSKFYGATGHYGIEIDNPNTTINIYDSLIKGSTGNVPIIFNVNSDKKLQMKNSIILHGSEVTYPIGLSGNAIVGVRIYNCVSNYRICNNEISNYIVNNNNNISDPEIIF